MTSRKFKEKEFKLIAEWIHRIIESNGSKKIINDVKFEVAKTLKKYPIYKNIRY